ncbi:MAG: nuclear transport factor 2 family protein [Bacteroidetes bacterium]|nr:nuclear transport factor 2 family protein [Bacteroidota bacterium]
MERNLVIEFVNFINQHDTEGISKLMSEEHVFTDSQGNIIQGRENMKKAWELYFEWFPDYTIEITDVIQGETCVAAFGFANGTFHNLHNEKNLNHFHLPSSWKIVLENDLVKKWQVFSDTKIPFEIMERNKTL